MPWCPTSPSCAPRAPSSRLRPHRWGPWVPERIRLGAGLSAAEAHSHTLASDGMVTAVELVRAAAAIGLSVICITDHDTLSPLEEATEVGAELGVEVVSGEEVTCAFPPGIHVVALFIDRAIGRWWPIRSCPPGPPRSPRAGSAAPWRRGPSTGSRSATPPRCSPAPGS